MRTAHIGCAAQTAAGFASWCVSYAPGGYHHNLEEVSSPVGQTQQWSCPGRFCKTPFDDSRDSAPHTRFGPWVKCCPHRPGLGNGMLDVLRPGLDGAKKRGMGSVFSVIRLSRRLAQVAGNDIRRHVVQDGAVKENGSTCTPLGITRNFHLANRQITDALECRGRFPATERAGDSLKDKLIGTADARQTGM